MGEPVEFSVKMLEEARLLAREVVESVRRDGPFPISGLSEFGKFKVLLLAQALIHETDAS